MSDKSDMPGLVPYFCLMLVFLCLSQGAVAGVMSGYGLQPGQPQWREALAPSHSGTSHPRPGRTEWLVAAQGQDRGETSPEPLLMPGQYEAEDDKEKKCMTVCARWGEECMIDNVTGTRKCRRTCKEFGQECF